MVEAEITGSGGYLNAGSGEGDREKAKDVRDQVTARIVFTDTEITRLVI